MCHSYMKHEEEEADKANDEESTSKKDGKKQKPKWRDHIKERMLKLKQKQENNLTHYLDTLGFYT